ncbi:MAG TPA: 2-polyprenyl-3-methyl-6-methoxy-1,4-benzoquinone monooxygenase [Gammaproteobacteria bacterium]|nr:2-polyprenyl-3-methyl-6-methoxy-1,4-benzoquinone monooxygenase [Gammaproteobacteria bacterium]
MDSRRRYTPIDRALIEFDHAARTILGKPAAARREYPAAGLDEPQLTEGGRRLAGRLMRVNHAGEVSAQALYRGQAAVTPTERVRERMMHAADEEQDHLAWCARRIDELHSRHSRLDGFWYLGSFAIGALAGIAGDRYSLGFVAETERQVEQHLEGHLHRLPEEDARSRSVITTMQADEVRHGHAATQAGGRKLPRPVQRVMRFASRVMTSVAFWV